jgi:alpha-mannosidase
LGRHTWAFSLGLVDPVSWKNSELLYKHALEFNHPSIVQAFVGRSGVPLKPLPFIRIEGGGVVVTAIKRSEPKRWDVEEAEERRSLIIRVFEIQGRDATVTITLPGESIIGCTLMDIHEYPLQQQKAIVKDGYALVPIQRYGIQTIQIEIS